MLDAGTYPKISSRKERSAAQERLSACRLYAACHQREHPETIRTARRNEAKQKERHESVRGMELGNVNSAEGCEKMEIADCCMQPAAKEIRIYKSSTAKIRR
jgi:hypothetical protein